MTSDTTHSTPYLRARLSPHAPGFATLNLDSLGKGDFASDAVIGPPAASGPRLRFEGDRYFAAGGEQPLWVVEFDERGLVLRSTHSASAEDRPFEVTFDQKANHATLLGRMAPGRREMELPCLLHLPDCGSLRVHCDDPAARLGYDARRWEVEQPFVRVEFPPATAEMPRRTYRLEVVAIHPPLEPGHTDDPLLDGFRRGWLNIFQVNPRLQMLANNASSDNCAFTLFEYAEIARRTPELAPGLTAADLVRMSLDRYLSGQLGYGQRGYAEGAEIGRASGPEEADLVPWGTGFDSLDTRPSFLISACRYVEASGDVAWAEANFDALGNWLREMFAADRDGNGLIEYPAGGNFGDRPNVRRRPANWWDTINFGHEDAFSNALAHHAATLFADLAEKLGRSEAADFARERAAALRAAYAPAFLNPGSGLLAGWRSADGQLHDYAFTFIQGMAVVHGLVDDDTARRILRATLDKLDQVGYRRFDLGLPGNLEPVPRGDYVDHEGPPEEHGVPRREDGSDAFQFYENGGATGCWAYYLVSALRGAGFAEECHRIFGPMLETYARRGFQGFGENGRSRDWRDWNGGCHGYEGMLVDNYFTFLAADEIYGDPG